MNRGQARIYIHAAVQRGFTLIELIVVIVIVCSLAAVGLDRLLGYQELAEKAAMEATAQNIKMGLQMRLAELLIANRQSEVAQLESENPLRWLQEGPANYRGEYREPVAPGNWYYDERERQLVYAVNRGSNLEVGGEKDIKLLRFRPQVVKQTVEASGRQVLTPVGVTLTPVTPYQWRNNGPNT
jgi:prepilin-type N-terminal cleavage/methylation domain-containing protein